MEYLTLAGGLKLPKVGFGTWDVRGPSGLKTLLQAVECGYRHFDTAHMYGNEDIVGQCIAQCGLPRSELFITTKLDSAADSYKGAVQGIARALELLRTDYIDLLLIHEPYADETVNEMQLAMEEAAERGQIRALGVSNFSLTKVQRFYQHARIKPVLMQAESHVYFPQLQLAQGLKPLHIVLESWAPFTEGRRPIFKDPVLLRIGAHYGKSAAQIALRYLIQQGIPVIPKSSHVKRMRENLDIFDFSLSHDDLQDIKALDGGQSLFGWYQS